MAEVESLVYKELSPHAVVTQLQKDLPDIAEMYIVVKGKDGSFSETICGDTGGLAFSIIVLQKYLMGQIDE